MIAISAAVAYVLAAATEPKRSTSSHVISTTREKPAFVDSPFVTYGDRMVCNTPESAERLAQLAQPPSDDSIATGDTESAIDTVNAENDDAVCSVASLHYAWFEEIKVIPSRNGTVLLHIFKLHEVTSFRLEADENKIYDWTPIEGGPKDEYVIVPTYGSVI